MVAEKVLNSPLFKGSKIRDLLPEHVQRKVTIA